MSIQQSFALDPILTAKCGKIFGTIDFIPRKGLVRADILSKKENTIVGEFSIGDHVYSVSIAELDRIIETAQAGKEVFRRMYIFGK